MRATLCLVIALLLAIDVSYGGSLPSRGTCILTFHDGQGDVTGDLARVSIENKRSYSERNGYRFIHETETLDRERPAAWNKILYVQRHLFEGCDGVLFMDADSFVTNHSIRIEDVVGRYSGYDVVFTKEPKDVVNTGVFYVRPTPWAITFLTRVFGYTSYINHGLWEQAAIGEVLKKNMYEEDKKVAIIPQRSMNSFYDDHGGGESAKWQPGDFVLHITGFDREGTERAANELMGHIYLGQH